MLHKPILRRARPRGVVLEKKYKLYFKHDSCSMLFAKNLTIAAASLLKDSIERNVESRNITLEGHFIITQ